MANDTVWTSPVDGIYPSDIVPDFGLILDSIPDGVYGVDPAGQLTMINRAAAQMLGYQPQELIGRVPHEVMHHTRPDGTPFPRSECPLVQAADEERIYRSEHDIFWRRDGTSFPVEYESRPLSGAGRVFGAVVTFRDITAKLKHEERLRELLREQFARARAEFQQTQLREALAQTPASIAVTRGPRHVIELVNDRYRQLIGGRAVVGLSVREAFPDADHRQLASMDQAFESGEPVQGVEQEVAVRVDDRTERRFFNYVYQPLRDESGIVYGLMTHAIDVTREVEARRALETQSRRALLTAAVGVSLTRPLGLRGILQECAEAVVTYLDAAFARIWTLDTEEQVLELQASAGMYSHLDGPHSRVPVGRFKIGLIAQEREPHLTNNVIDDPRVGDQQWARRERMRAFAGYPLMVGDELVGVLAMFSRHTLEDDDLQALATVAHGVALGIQRKRNEIALESRADELARIAITLARTNQDLDAFAYAASHDLRAPLRGIANLAQWIEEDLTASASLKSETREMLELMRSRMHRMEALIEGILQYSRAGRITDRIEDVDTGRVVREVVELLAVPDHITVTVAPDLPVIRSAAPPLQQTFMNLIGNAVKYNDSPEPRIEITSRDDGPFVEFAVRDNGPGIAPEYHDRIWGIFQTLEARDTIEGTGIGLSLVKKLVEAQGGRAWVESAAGAGATFRFLWPRQQGSIPSRTTEWKKH